MVERESVCDMARAAPVATARTCCRGALWFILVDAARHVSHPHHTRSRVCLSPCGGVCGLSAANRIFQATEEGLADCTHLISQWHNTDSRPLIDQARRLNKPIANLLWLEVVLAQGFVSSPARAEHMPCALTLQPLQGRSIACTHFSGEERTSIKTLINSLGGCYTGYFAKTHFCLVARTCDREGVKCAKAVEWDLDILPKR